MGAMVGSDDKLRAILIGFVPMNLHPLLATLLVTLALATPTRALPVEYWSDHFVVLVEDEHFRPVHVVLDFNRGTSGVAGRERAAEFVGHFFRDGTWHDLQSGEYAYPGGDMTRLVGNGVCRPSVNRRGGWTLDYDGGRTSFLVETEEPVLLHVQRDDPELTNRYAGASGTFELGGKRYPATVFHEQVRWRGYNRLVGVTPKRMYGHFDWMPLVSRRGDWWLLIQDPGQASVPDDAPDHNWGVYRSPEGILRPLPADEFRIYAQGHRHTPSPRLKRFRGQGGRMASFIPGSWQVHLPTLQMRGELRDVGHMLDRFDSGLFSVVGSLYLPGAGRRDVHGVVDHIERSR